jgi:hypothetical protein
MNLASQPVIQLLACGSVNFSVLPPSPLTYTPQVQCSSASPSLLCASAIEWRCSYQADSGVSETRVKQCNSNAACAPAPCVCDDWACWKVIQGSALAPVPSAFRSNGCHPCAASYMACWKSELLHQSRGLMRACDAFMFKAIAEPPKLPTHRLQQLLVDDDRLLWLGGTRTASMLAI